MTTTDNLDTKAEETLTEWVDGLVLARWHLRHHPQLADKATIYPDKILVFSHDPEEYASLVRDLMDGAPVGEIRKTADDNYSKVSRFFGPVEVYVFTPRETVCERRQVGVETVELPDPDAPKITVERPVYEWECAPLLAVGTAVPA